MSVLRDGPLEITRSGVTISEKKSCKRNLSKIKILQTVISKKKILSEKATSIVFKVFKSMG